MKKTFDDGPLAKLSYAKANADAIAELKARYSPSAESAEAAFAPDVQKAVDDFIAVYGGTENAYAVFDFDNTCSVFDVEEQLLIHQLLTMSFEIKPENLAEILLTGLDSHDEDRTSLGYGKGSYSDWVSDITAAYTYLYKTYGPFSAAGLDKKAQETVHSDPMWLEFAAKMRTMYDLVCAAESPEISYPWVHYWFTGMTEQEVYDFSYVSHSHFGSVETSRVKWISPSEIESKVGVVEYIWTSGAGVSEQVRGLWKALCEAGIDVWVCSASATDPIRAAIDVFGLHDYITGVVAMTGKVADGVYVNEYDYETGCGWLNDGCGGWIRDNAPIKAQTHGTGKVMAINNAIFPKYNNVGPLAGFMDSTGDWNFCTEYANLKLVVCFNRASRKITDGGGLASAIALYQRDYLGYDLAFANANGDTLYVLQGREENGLRSLRNRTAAMLLGAKEEQLLKNDDNYAQLYYIVSSEMTTEEAINLFTVKTSAKDSVIGIKYGFADEYSGYHRIG